MVSPVREARGHGAPPFVRFEADGVAWPDGSHGRVDAVIWCTDFRPALDHFAPLGVLEADGVAWPDGSHGRVDAVIWCTDFRPALDHFAPLGVLEADGCVAVREGSRSVREPRLWPVGYGEWTGTALVMLAGVTRAAWGRPPRTSRRSWRPPPDHGRGLGRGAGAASGP